MERSKHTADVYIGLGSNIGCRESYLRKALERIDAHPAIQILRCSDIYETEPVGYVEQDAFLNMVVAVRTDLSPVELLGFIQQTERLLGRTRDIRWGPRTIDLDILLFGNEQIRQPHLEIPHPRMWDRLFVLIPLADVYEGGRLPGNVSLEERINQLEGKEGIVRWKEIRSRKGLEHFVN